MFTIDGFSNLEALNIYAADPSGGLIQCLNYYIDETSSSLTLGINQQYELNFSIYKDPGVDSSWFDHLQEGMYLFVDKIGLFKIKQPSISMDGVKEFKTITAYSCDVELEDKNCNIEINMGTKTSQEYLVTYNENETEVLINPYTGIPYDWIVLYNTFPEQLNGVMEKYNSGYYGIPNENEDIIITENDIISEMNSLLSTIPRLKNKVTSFLDDSGISDYTFTEYVSYEYDETNDNITSITLFPTFKDRLQELITYYTRYRDQLSLLCLVLENTGGNWTVGDIYGVDSGDYSLANKKYQFEADGSIYSFLTQTFAQTSKCIVSFDTLRRKINVTPVEHIGNDTGIVIAYDTLINSINISCNDDVLYTRLFVTGSDDLGIDQVNFGLPYVDDITYKLNAKDSKGRRIYVSDELAEKYMEYIKFREQKRTLYIQYSKDYNNYNSQISEIKHRVPADSLKTDWGTYTLEELNAALTSYKNLMVVLITLYKEDYGYVGINEDESVNENHIKGTIYWQDYIAYRDTIQEIKCAIETFPYYSDQDKWTSENLDKYKDAVSAWETEWTLYGSIELQAKISSYTQNMNILAESAVIRISEDSDDIKKWVELTDEERTSYGNLESNYYYAIYMDYYRKRESAKEYLDELLQQISDLEELQNQVQDARNQLAEEVKLENHFTEKECRIINRLYKDSSYSNENILITSIDDAGSKIDRMYELLQDGQEQVSILARPQLIFSIDADNLLALPQFKCFWRDFQPGNYMYIQYQDSTYMQLRMISYTFNPCLPYSKEFSMTFSNYTQSKSKITDFGNLLGLSTTTSSGSSGNSGHSDGSIYGESDDIDVTISNTMLAKLLNTETFATRVTDVILDTIDVKAITAKSATFGGLSSGTTIIDGKCIETGFIRDKDYNGTDGEIDNTSGSVINLEMGNFNFAGGKLVWDGDILSIDGEVTATSGRIGGWNISPDSLWRGSNAWGTPGNTNIYLGDNGISLSDKLKFNSSDGALEINGKITATSGYIGGTSGFEIGSAYIRNGDIASATNTSVSGVYIGTDGFNVSGGTSSTTSYFTKNGMNIGGKLTWDGSTLSVNGNVTTGNLQATGGKIANFTISNGFLFNGINIGTSGSCGISCGSSLGGSDDRIFWAGDGAFRVTKDGVLYATNANLTGNITANDLAAKDRIYLYLDGNYDNSKCKIISFNFYEGAVGSQFYELLIGKSNGSFLGETDDDKGLFYGRTRIIGKLKVDGIIDSLSVDNNISFGNNSGYDSSKSISMPWVDGSNHPVIFGDNDGLTCRFGWAGSETYKSVSIIRGQTIKCTDSSGTTTLSDERLKKDFAELDKWEDFYLNIEPTAFKMKNGSSNRYHIGFKAGQIKKSLEENGLTTSDFGGFISTKYNPTEEDSPMDIKVHEENNIRPGDEEYGLIYNEFIAMNTHMIQKLYKKIELLKNEIKELKETIK